jgi:phosphoglycerol transferase MdoB-like AlkP superfamily enzyme
MTASSHGPYILPPYFTPKPNDIVTQLVEYADWSLRQLVTLSAKEEWFNNTLFVFVADHGGVYAPLYDMPLSYHHSPFVIYAPHILKEARALDLLTEQIDVFPIVMGLLSLPYVNNTLGVDVLAQPRPYVYFCADNKYGVLDKEYFLVTQESGEAALYRYADKDTKNVIAAYPEHAAAMRDYALSNMQAYQYALDNGALYFGEGK